MRFHQRDPVCLAGRDPGGKTAIVTGGYSGLGLETVKTLAAAGVAVTVPARRPDAATAALVDVPGVTVRQTDLGDLDSPDQTDATTGGVTEWAIDVDTAECLFTLSVQATALNPFAD